MYNIPFVFLEALAFTVNAALHLFSHAHIQPTNGSTVQAVQQRNGKNLKYNPT